MRTPEGVLGNIVTHKLDEVAQRRREVPLDELRRRAAAAPPPRSLRAALSRPGARFILEHKRASPSKGTLGAERRPRDVARAYDGAADAVSVLTDARFFGGSFADLREIRAAIAVPVLCKDFVVDPYQVVEARAHGADAVLIMLSVLDDGEAAACLAEVGALGMDALVEVHDEGELHRALALPPAIIGINHRDLKTLSVDLAVSERLAPLVPADRLIVAESGIETRADIDRLAPLVDAFLVGSSLMRAPDARDAARALVFGRVKVCGLTSPEDARLAAGAGATLGGLIFAPASPRCVSDTTTGVIAASAALPLAGVFVNEDMKRVAALATDLGLVAVQLHGDEDADYVRALRPLLRANCAIWKVERPGAEVPAAPPSAHAPAPAPGRLGAPVYTSPLSVRTPAPASQRSERDAYTPPASMRTPSQEADRVLFDTPSAAGRGGTGETFDWSLVAGHPRLATGLLAGGIGPDNAVRARAVGAWAIDVCSRLEERPGKKDPALVAQLFANLRGPARAKGSV